MKHYRSFCLFASLLIAIQYHQHVHAAERKVAIPHKVIELPNEGAGWTGNPIIYRRKLYIYNSLRRKLTIINRDNLDIKKTINIKECENSTHKINKIYTAIHTLDNALLLLDNKRQKIVLLHGSLTFAAQTVEIDDYELKFFRSNDTLSVSAKHGEKKFEKAEISASKLSAVLFDGKRYAICKRKLKIFSGESNKPELEISVEHDLQLPIAIPGKRRPFLILIARRANLMFLFNTKTQKMSDGIKIDDSTLRPAADKHYIYMTSLNRGTIKVYNIAQLIMLTADTQLQKT